VLKDQWQYMHFCDFLVEKCPDDLETVRFWRAIEDLIKTDEPLKRNDLIEYIKAKFFNDPGKVIDIQVGQLSW
jgi:hypothetical protein